MTGLTWLVFGAFIGVIAAQKRGFGTAAGLIGGALLGPISLLMFFASGSRRKCPSCQEWIQKKASVCPHCQREVAAV